MSFPFVEELPAALAELLSFDDLARVASVRRSTLQNLVLANRFLVSSHLSGVVLYGWRPVKAALLQQIYEAIQPQPLLQLNRWCRKTRYSPLTTPMPVALDTSGTFFIHLWMSAANAANGCPSLGVIDADAAPQSQDAASPWLDDLSRPQQFSKTFGLACNPYAGTLHCSDVTILNLPPYSYDLSQTRRARSRKSRLAWESSEGGTRGSWRTAIEMGVHIRDGTLEFFRTGPNGDWQRSGTVCEFLPRKILICSFVFDFVGQACASVKKVYLKKLPDFVSDIPELGSAELSWSAWPAV